MLIPPFLQPDRYFEVNEFQIEHIIELFVVSAYHDFDSDLISITEYNLVSFQ